MVVPASAAATKTAFVKIHLREVGTVYSVVSASDANDTVVALSKIIPDSLPIIVAVDPLPTVNVLVVEFQYACASVVGGVEVPTTQGIELVALDKFKALILNELVHSGAVAPLFI